MARPPCSWISATGRLEALVALQPGLQEDAQEMAAAGRDFFGDDHVHAAAALAGQALAFDRGLDALVVGDGDHVEVRVRSRRIRGSRRPRRSHPRRSNGCACPPGRAPRRDVMGDVRPAPLVGAFSCCSVDCSRSGQIGWNRASHCSGASMMNCSKSRASSRAIARLRSRRSPPPAAAAAAACHDSGPGAVRRTAPMYTGAPVSAARSAGPAGNLGRGAEQLDLDAAAGDVAIGHEPDRLVAAQRGYQLGRASLRLTIRVPTAARVE
jgi:hypothetical protein